MEKIVNTIIDIDKQTKDIKLKTEEIVAEKSLELKEKLYNLEKQSILEAKKEGESLYKEIIKLGEYEVEKLEIKDISSLKEVDNIYNNQKEVLIKEIFESLFLQKE